jgi:hypothetical protein
MRDDFGILIMSYGRPNDVASLSSLLKSNYTGKWFIVVGDDDPALEGYREVYGDKLAVFDKDDYIAKTDRMGLKITKVICFARNACFDIAEQLGLRYFQQFDDDYTGFYFPYNEKIEYLSSRPRIANYDRAITSMIDYYEKLPSKCAAIAFSQGGDFIGGGDNKWGDFRVLRKSMNSWLCSIDRRFSFQGCMNEDVNAYTSLQSRGMLCLNIMQIRLEQPVTQTTGGMTPVYRQYGTHVKSFLTVMLNPSCVRVGAITYKQQRLHHRIDWNKCAAKIVRESHKKV